MKPARVDELICGWSMMTGHSFSEVELNSLVDLISQETEKGVKSEGPTGMKCPKCGSGAFPWRPCCGHKLTLVTNAKKGGG